MLEDILQPSRIYFDENEYNAAPPIPLSSQLSVAVNVYSSDGNEDALKFKYVQEEEFARIVRQVKRNKKKERDDREWAELLTETKIVCTCDRENKESESLTLSALSTSGQNVVDEDYDEDLKQTVLGQVNVDCQKYCNAFSKESSSEAFHVLDTGIGEEMCMRKENTMVVQKANAESTHMLKLLPHPKLSKHSHNISLKTIQEMPLCLPNSHICMLNGTKCICQRSSCHMNKNCELDMPSSFHQCHAFQDEAYNVLPSLVAKLNPCITSRESIHSQRIRFMWKKMSAAFDDIISLYNKIAEPDGSQELLRRCKRAAEFSCRFSRNYLYQLQLQVCELRKQTRASSSLPAAQHTLHQLVCRKLVVAHHSALQGLQAYLHHMPSSVQCAASGKLKELLHYICELSTLCNRVGITAADSGPDHIEKKSRALLQLINSKNLVYPFENGLLASHDSVVNITITNDKREWERKLQKPEETRVPKISERGQCSARKCTSWKLSATKLAREVYGYPAKKRGSEVIKRDRRFAVSNDGLPVQCDSASVANMRHVPNKQLGISKEVPQDKRETALRNLVYKSKAEVSEDGIQKPDGQNSAPVDDMNPVVQQVKNTVSRPLHQTERQHITQRTDEIKITKIGSQNAQLIFLTPHPYDTFLDHEDNASKTTRLKSQDTTVSCEVSDTHGHSVHCSHKSSACCKLKPNVHMNSVKSKTNMYHQHRSVASPELHHFEDPFVKPPTHAKTKENIGSKQCKSRLQTQLTVPMKVLQSAVEYNRRFHSYMKSHPMYESTAAPWIMISRLTDQIIERVLQEVARETKLESLVQNIYTLELQEERCFSDSHH